MTFHWYGIAQPRVYFCQNSYFSCVLVAVDDDDNDNDDDDGDVHDERCL